MNYAYSALLLWVVLWSPAALEVITKMPRTQTGKPAKEELKKDSSLTSEV